ncbi:permease [Candidatus Micrarchaeota archaeon]|nr:permease [Candidatus Micrarchaeota archaeon]
MLQLFADFIVFQLFSMSPEDTFAEVLNYFIYDTLKVILLLAVMSFLVSILRTFITPEKVKAVLGGKREGMANILAALLGIPTPFCSCSAVPLFIGFVESGVPLGATFSFLIASPMINEIAVALLLGLVGWKATALYILAGFLVAVFAGIIIGKLNLENELEDFVKKTKARKPKQKKMNWKQRINFAKYQSVGIVRNVFPYIVFGVAFGAVIHGYAPTDFLAKIAGEDNPIAVPIAVLAGIPLYSNAAGTIPIIDALMEKGMALGTALALMMSITALSLPEMIILRKVLKPKLILLFAGILAISFILVGLLFNFLQLSGYLN